MELKKKDKVMTSMGIGTVKKISKCGEVEIDITEGISIFTNINKIKKV